MAIRDDLAPGTVFVYADPHITKARYYVPMDNILWKGAHPDMPPFGAGCCDATSGHREVTVIWAPPTEPEFNEHGEISL